MTADQTEPDMLVAVTTTINGEVVTDSVPPRLHAADFLRQRLGLTGTHIGCEQGSCGMCTIVVDGEAVKSCLMLACQLDGRNVQTVESLAVDDGLNPLQQAFKEAHALQCGFCTPGFLMTATALGYQGDRWRPVPLHRLREHRHGHRELVRRLPTAGRWRRRY
jgi:aerobic-type carbon monoxide dehydrogenase small subunit (CoxS/CutS family)